MCLKCDVVPGINVRLPNVSVYTRCKRRPKGTTTSHALVLASERPETADQQICILMILSFPPIYGIPGSDPKKGGEAGIPSITPVNPYHSKSGDLLSNSLKARA